jgi:hypothetical protein
MYALTWIGSGAHGGQEGRDVLISNAALRILYITWSMTCIPSPNSDLRHSSYICQRHSLGRVDKLRIQNMIKACTVILSSV